MCNGCSVTLLSILTNTVTVSLPQPINNLFIVLRGHNANQQLNADIFVQDKYNFSSIVSHQKMTEKTQTLVSWQTECVWI